MMIERKGLKIALFYVGIGAITSAILDVMSSSNITFPEYLLTTFLYPITTFFAGGEASTVMLSATVVFIISTLYILYGGKKK